jgi:hypothetical protein
VGTAWDVSTFQFPWAIVKLTRNLGLLCWEYVKGKIVRTVQARGKG